MNPNLPENQPGQAPALPVDPAISTGPIPPTPNTAMPQQSATSASNAPQQMAERTKQLLQQYGRDPFKLSGSFGQLKEQYLAEQYQVTSNLADK